MNLANKLTIVRILLVPIFIFFIIFDIPFGEYIAAAIFVIAALTDSLDGYIARKKNQITKFGKFMDPLADKLLVSSALILLVEMDKLPAWVVIIIIAREFAVTGLRLLAASEGITIAANWWGKIKTITQIFAIISLLINNFPFNRINFAFDKLLIAMAVFFTIVSGIDYFYINRKVFIVNKK